MPLAEHQGKTRSSKRPHGERTYRVMGQVACNLLKWGPFEIQSNAMYLFSQQLMLTMRQSAIHWDTWIMAAGPSQCQTSGGTNDKAGVA